ncbi:hypothetical protein ADK60_37590 [Streptomyces sp. XY431]|uniref:hypothetical protein n=1 Tax=Streptomyces sp. XY431 TaxID=1415562 RepID=UPI0006AEAB12|nr:hypothetical protein [Streptomyces sp. XY431]KOV10745.1 hypothetical protein ADK60_37590 [Streptomyces sp. XY431]
MNPSRPARLRISGQVSTVDLLIAEASHDPRMRFQPFTGTAEDAVTSLAAHRALMELRPRRALPAAPRRCELPPGPARADVVVLDEAAYLIGRSRTGKQSPGTARLIRQIIAAGRTTRING